MLFWKKNKNGSFPAYVFARVRRAHFVSDSGKKNGVHLHMGQGDFVLKMG